jgi:hypothetical protein
MVSIILLIVPLVINLTLEFLQYVDMGSLIRAFIDALLFPLDTDTTFISGTKCTENTLSNSSPASTDSLSESNTQESSGKKDPYNRLVEDLLATEDEDQEYLDEDQEYLDDDYETPIVDSVPVVTFPVVVPEFTIHVTPELPEAKDLFTILIEKTVTVLSKLCFFFYPEFSNTKVKDKDASDSTGKCASEHNKKTSTKETMEAEPTSSDDIGPDNNEALWLQYFKIKSEIRETIVRDLVRLLGKDIDFTQLGLDKPLDDKSFTAFDVYRITYVRSVIELLQDYWTYPAENKLFRSSFEIKRDLYTRMFKRFNSLHLSDAERVHNISHDMCMQKLTDLFMADNKYVIGCRAFEDAHDMFHTAFAQFHFDLLVKRMTDEDLLASELPMDYLYRIYKFTWLFDKTSKLVEPLRHQYPSQKEWEASEEVDYLNSIYEYGTLFDKQNAFKHFVQRVKSCKSSISPFFHFTQMSAATKINLRFMERIMIAKDHPWGIKSLAGHNKRLSSMSSFYSRLQSYVRVRFSILGSANYAMFKWGKSRYKDGISSYKDAFEYPTQHEISQNVYKPESLTKLKSVRFSIYTTPTFPENFTRSQKDVHRGLEFGKSLHVTKSLMNHIFFKDRKKRS